MKSYNRFDSDKVLSISAIIIAIVSIFIGIWQGSETRKHNRLSVQPRLSIQHSLNYADQSLSLILINKGLGPAILETIKYEYESKFYEITNNHNILDFLDRIDLKVPLSFDRFAPGVTITSNDVYTILRIDLKDLESIKVSPGTLISKFKFEIIYSSLYRERFTCSHP